MREGITQIGIFLRRGLVEDSQMESMEGPDETTQAVVKGLGERRDDETLHGEVSQH